MGKISAWMEFWVGVFVILVVVALVFIGFRVTTPSVFTATEGYTVTAKFRNIGSLKRDAKVSMSGVLIGRVKGIALDPSSFKAIVHLEISNDYNNIPIDSSASIMTSGILGDQYIGIDAGADDFSLANGDEISLTQSAIILEELVNKLVTSFTEK